MTPWVRRLLGGLEGLIARSEPTRLDLSGPPARRAPEAGAADAGWALTDPAPRPSVPARVQRIASPPTRMVAALSQPAGWDPAAVALYHGLVRARLAERRCVRCGERLEDGAVVRAEDGTSLDEHGLSDAGAAHLLAGTQRLTVRCRCGELDVVPPPGSRGWPPPTDAPADRPWTAGAVRSYVAALRQRLGAESCRSCSASLARGRLLRASAAAGPEAEEQEPLATLARRLAEDDASLLRGRARDFRYIEDVSEETNLLRLARAQDLRVRCACGAVTELPGRTD